MANPMEKLQATREGYHGRFFRIGDVATRGQLERLGGFVPEYFVPVDSQEIDDPADLEEVRNWLTINHVPWTDQMTLEELEVRREAKRAGKKIEPTSDPEPSDPAPPEPPKYGVRDARGDLVQGHAYVAWKDALAAQKSLNEGVPGHKACKLEDDSTTPPNPLD